jgi:hypothetical protein
MAQIWIALITLAALTSSFFLLVVPPQVIPAADSLIVDLTRPAWPPMAAFGLVTVVMAATPDARGWLSWTSVAVLVAGLLLLGSLAVLVRYWLSGAMAL